MVDEVIDAFKRRIKKNHTWIDDSTKEHVLAKVKKPFSSLIQSSNISNFKSLMQTILM